MNVAYRLAVWAAVAGIIAICFGDALVMRIYFALALVWTLTGFAQARFGS